MMRFKLSDLRGGITLSTFLWRWGYLHQRGGPDVEIGEVVFVGPWLFWVTRIHYVTYRDGSVYAVVSLMRFRWLECIVGGLTVSLFALIISP